MSELVYTDSFGKTITLLPTAICVEKKETNKYGHAYKRIIPYSAVQKINIQNGTFFYLGFISLITIAGGVPYNTAALNPAKSGAVMDDETTLWFDRKQLQEIKNIAQLINERRVNAVDSQNNLSEFWGMTFAERKDSLITLQPDGLHYNRKGSHYVLPYTEVLLVEYVPQNLQMTILSRGLDEKIRLKQYKKYGEISETDDRFSFGVFDTEPLWANHFLKALNIILDNKHLIPFSKGSLQDVVLASDIMNGYEFESYCGELLKRNGFENVDITPKSGDQGVDILATKDGIKYAFQCKHYASPLGNTPVQEVHAGKQYYNCHVGVVMTNSSFTSSAIHLADATGVLLWDGRKLRELAK